VWRYLFVVFSKEKKLYNQIYRLFGFWPGNISLYKLALKHKSMVKEWPDGFRNSNERLEFLGDAILSVVVAEYLFKTFPYKDEGFMSEMRSKIVSKTQLHNIAVKMGVDNMVDANVDKSGKSKVVCDAFEALIGAMFLDKGYAFTQKILIRKVIFLFLNLEELQNQIVNFKSKLIEWAQKERKNIQFETINEVGYGNHKQFVVQVLIDSQPKGTGRDFSKKKAEQLAAQNAFEELGIV
jgi:ribonuclease-3